MPCIVCMPPGKIKSIKLNMRFNLKLNFIANCLAFVHFKIASRDQYEPINFTLQVYVDAGRACAKG